MERQSLERGSVMESGMEVMDDFEGKTLSPPTFQLQAGAGFPPSSPSSNPTLQLKIRPHVGKSKKSKSKKNAAGGDAESKESEAKKAKAGDSKEESGGGQVEAKAEKKSKKKKKGSGPKANKITVAENQKGSDGEYPSTQAFDFDAGDTVLDLANYLGGYDIRLMNSSKAKKEKGKGGNKNNKAAAKSDDLMLHCSMGAPLMPGGKYSYKRVTPFEGKKLGGGEADRSEGLSIVQKLSLMMYTIIRKSNLDCHEIQGMMLGSAAVFSSNFEDVFQSLAKVLSVKSVTDMSASGLVDAICDTYKKLVANDNEKFKKKLESAEAKKNSKSKKNKKSKPEDKPKEESKEEAKSKSKGTEKGSKSTDKAQTTKEVTLSEVQIETVRIAFKSKVKAKKKTSSKSGAASLGGKSNKYAYLKNKKSNNTLDYYKEKAEKEATDKENHDKARNDVEIVKDPAEFEGTNAAIVFLTGEGKASERSQSKKSGKKPPLHAEQNLMLALINYLTLTKKNKHKIEGVVLGGVKSPCGSCKRVMTILEHALTQSSGQQIKVADKGMKDTDYGVDKTAEIVKVGTYSKKLQEILAKNSKDPKGLRRVNRLQNLLQDFAKLEQAGKLKKGKSSEQGDSQKAPDQVKDANLSSEGVKLVADAVTIWINKNINDLESAPDGQQVSNIIAITKISPSRSLNEACHAVLGKSSENFHLPDEIEDELPYQRYNCLITALNRDVEPSAEDLVAIRNSILFVSNISIGETLYEDEEILQVISQQLGISGRHYAIVEGNTIRYFDIQGNGIVVMHGGERPGDANTQFDLIEFTSGGVGHFEYKNLVGVQHLDALIGD